MPSPRYSYTQQGLKDLRVGAAKPVLIVKLARVFQQTRYPNPKPPGPHAQHSGPTLHHTGRETYNFSIGNATGQFPLFPERVRYPCIKVGGYGSLPFYDPGFVEQYCRILYRDCIDTIYYGYAGSRVA